jgi:hypothetical protein
MDANEDYDTHNDDTRSTLSGNTPHLLDDAAGTTDLASRVSPGHYVLCIDPESFLYYRKDLFRNDYIVFEPFADERTKNDFFKAN